MMGVETRQALWQVCSTQNESLENLHFRSMNMADNSHRSQEGDVPKPTAGATSHEKPSSALPDIGSSWRSKAASFVAPPFPLGYTNITVIKDLCIGSKRKERSDCEGDGSAFHEQESGASPKTTEELLAISKYDESKKINETDYYYLRGCLDMLLAVRKDYSLEIALPSKLSKILMVDENSWSNFFRLQAERSSNQPSHTEEGMKDSSHHQYQSANQEKPHEGRNTSPQPQNQSSPKSSTESTAGFHIQATASVPHTNSNVLVPSVSLCTSPPSRESQQPEQTPAYIQGERSISSSSPSSTPFTQQSNMQSVPAAHHNHSSSKPTFTSPVSRSSRNASDMAPYTPPTSTGYGSHSSGMYTATKQHQSDKKSNSWFAPKKKEPRRIPVTMVSNSVNEMTDSLLRSFIESLNTAEVVYDVATVQPQQVLPEQQCIVGCVSASRLQSDVNATLALFTAHKPRALVVLVLHPKAPHVRLHAGAGDKLGAVPGVHAFIDAVFWDARLYACNTNTQANADFQRFFHA